jgi:hypothetical protein
MSNVNFARWWAAVCVLICAGSSAFAQGARVNPTGAGPEADRDDPAGRDRWFMQGRVAPAGKSAADLRWRAYQQKIQMRAARLVAAHKGTLAGKAQAALAAAGTAWSPLGPAPLVSDPGSGQNYGFVSGRATAVAIDPADATGNTVYLGGAFGGVWRSKNAGGLSSNPNSVTWTPMTDAQATLAVGAVALQPCSNALSNCDATNHLSKTILVGTGEPNSAVDSYYGLGILRSIDGGSNWSLIGSANSGANSFKGLGFSKIAFNSTAGKENNVVAASGSTIGNQDGARVNGQISGPFVSMDSGASWAAAPVTDGSFGGTVAPISTTSVVFNASAGASGTFYMAMRYHGIYSSTDGTSWTRLATQPGPSGAGINSATDCPTALPSLPACPFYRGELAVVPGRSEMYAWYIDANNSDQGIWRSTDGGGSWTQLDDTNITSCGDTDGCGTVQGFYDLELAAVPNGASSTDLYAGTRNLFKCTLGSTVSSASCSGTGTSSFQNLTHVYNCSGHATVHPDQHAIASMVVSGTDVLYFASDGGIYRALDGFTGLVSNSCVNNQFGNLNGTLGSMTQFVSFSQSPRSSAILLGGTQDNGSPATSQTNTNWHSVNGGDGGYNEIDPANPNNWYTANTDISIQRCTGGTACNEGGFSLVADSSRLGGDSGAFYTPYILDPQNSNEMLVGTCRVWRGSATGTGFVAISPNFDQGFATICADPKTSVVNFVHAVAAGGPVGSNGFSKVIYVGLEGSGPLSSATPHGGRVFVTNDASANSINWSEITPPTNKSTFYTIGDIAVDPSDATGATAFLALQGFGTAHVLKTTNANLGINATWTDFGGSVSNALPNAPVNALSVDSSTNTIFAGTDVGVFSSLTGSPVWTEVGPAAAPGAVGYLPDSPVTRLRLFSSGGTKLLRASTYGRGIWEFPLAVGRPDFTVSVPTATLTTYPNQTVQYNGTLTSVNSYANPVNLTCTGGTPQVCSAAATPITPGVAPGAAFMINVAHGATGDFNFTIHAAGTDSVPQVHDTSATLHVVDFTLGAPNPTSVTINIPNPSVSITIPITESFNFADTLSFTCPNEAANKVHCAFSGISGTSATLAVTPTSGAVPSSFTLMISANSVASPAATAKTTTLSVTLTAIADYALTITQPQQATTALGNAIFSGTLTSVNGYPGNPITLSCPSSAPVVCPPLGQILLGKDPSSMNFAVTAASAVAGIFSFNIEASDGTIVHDVPVTLTVNAGFEVPPTVVTCTPVTAGGVSTCSIPIKPDGQATFANNVTYSCGSAGFPNLSFCSFNPASILAGSAGTTVVLSVHTTAPIALLRPSGPFRPTGPLLAFWLSLPALGIVSLGGQRSRKRTAALAGSLLVLALVVFMAACGGGASSGGGGGQPGTNKGTYTFNVIAVSNGITHNAPMTLTVN